MGAGTFWSRISLGIGVGAIAALCCSSVRAADAIDPALEKAWSFAQASMPGVPYSLLKAACAEGTLTIYHGTWSDAQAAQIDAFKGRFPCITVRPFELGTGPRRERFLAETRAGLYITDLVQDTDPGSLDDNIEQGLLMKYVISNDKDFADTVKHQGFWYPLRIGISTNAWNTDLVSDEQAKPLFEWKGAVDPTWKGRVGIVDPTSGGAVFLPWYYWHKAFGEDFFRKIGELQPRLFGLNQIGAALASGDIAVGIGISETPLTTLWLDKAPIKWSMPEPGVGPVTGQAIAAHAPHPNAAKLYQEYSFTLEGYEIWNKLGGPPARIGYEDKREVASQPWFKYPKVWFDYSTADVTKNRAQTLALYDKYVMKR